MVLTAFTDFRTLWRLAQTALRRTRGQNYNVPGGRSIVDAVDQIVAESACRRAMYIENGRRLHKFVDKIESEARDHLAIRDRVREAQIGVLHGSCRLPVVAMLSKEPQGSSRVTDLVSGLDWARIRVHYDVIVAAQNAGIMPCFAPASYVIEGLSGQPVECDVSVLRDFYSCRESV